MCVMNVVNCSNHFKVYSFTCASIQVFFLIITYKKSNNSFVVSATLNCPVFCFFVGEKPYSCDICDFTCRNSSGLYAHKVIHSEERPFKCDECGKTFKMKSWLKEHKKTHSGVKNFVCEVCNHAFIANYQLKSHMKTHSGERSHICEFCSRSFARRDTLSEHLRTHTKQTKYTCQSCNKDFMFLKQLKKHKCPNVSLETVVSELSMSSFDSSD